MKPNNMLRKLKVFHVLLIGSKPRLNTKGPRGCNKKAKRPKSSLNLEEGNWWSEGQPGCSNCMKRRWKDGKADWEKKDWAFTKIKYETNWFVHFFW